MVVLLLLVIFFAPYQFAFLVIVIVHLFSTIRCLVHAQETSSSSTSSAAVTPAAARRLWDRYHYAFAILVVLVTLLPINALILVVWVRNLAVGWLAPFSSDHNVLMVFGFLANVEALHSGKMLQRSSGGRCVTSPSSLSLSPSHRDSLADALARPPQVLSPRHGRLVRHPGGLLPPVRHSLGAPPLLARQPVLRLARARHERRLRRRRPKRCRLGDLERCDDGAWRRWRQEEDERAARAGSRARRTSRCGGRGVDGRRAQGRDRPAELESLLQYPVVQLSAVL